MVKEVILDRSYFYFEYEGGRYKGRVRADSGTLHEWYEVWVFKLKRCRFLWFKYDDIEWSHSLIYSDDKSLGKFTRNSDYLYDYGYDIDSVKKACENIIYSYKREREKKLFEKNKIEYKHVNKI